MKSIGYFAGIQYHCIAHYPMLVDQVDTWLHSRAEAMEFVTRHNARGANVEIKETEWVPVVRRLEFYDVRDMK